jgi:hypothetical protein
MLPYSAGHQTTGSKTELPKKVIPQQVRTWQSVFQVILRNTRLRSPLTTSDWLAKHKWSISLPEANSSRKDIARLNLASFSLPIGC